MPQATSIELKLLAFPNCITYSSPMRQVNLSAVDLNLLVALKALLDERHVSRAAEAVGLSQPAMSRALQRLRVLFNDSLLVRGQGGMTLTARAAELSQPLKTVLSEISHIITSPAVEPKDMQGDVVIATRDFEMTALLPSVLNKIMTAAPGLRLKIVPLQGDDLSPLAGNEVDFVVAGTDKTSAALCRQTLVKDNFVCLVSARNPVLQSGKSLSLAQYLAMKHCLTSITDLKAGIVDSYLAEHGHRRDVVLRVPYFMAAVSMVAHSDLIVTVPGRLGLSVAKHKDLAILDLPFEVRDVSIFLYWHLRNENNPMHVWLRSCFAV